MERYLKKLNFISIVLFSLSLSISSFAGEPFTIFDLKKDLSASSVIRTLPVFTNAESLTASVTLLPIADATSGACLLNYSKTPSLNSDCRETSLKIV